MSHEFFSNLGLKPGRYSPAEITRRFNTRRRRLVEALDQPELRAEALHQLNDLHRAHNALRDPRKQAEHLKAARGAGDEDRVERLRRLIDASLEGALLRRSRREEILAEGRRLGFSEFHTHLLIAQVQFGGEIVAPPRPRRLVEPRPSGSQVVARFAAAGALALAIFLATAHWLGA